MDLQDDPYRSLAGLVRRAGGYAKDQAPFVEFIWADFFRPRVAARLIRREPQRATRLGLRLACSDDARYLPGWTGKSAGGGQFGELSSGARSAEAYRGPDRRPAQTQRMIRRGSSWRWPGIRAADLEGHGQSGAVGEVQRYRDVIAGLQRPRGVFEHDVITLCGKA